MNTTFVQPGIAAFKLDECDGNQGQTWFFPDNSKWPSGFKGAQMHNLFGMTYSFTYHELFGKAGLRTFLKARAGYMGSQRYPTTMYSDSYDYDQYVTAVVNSGFLGIVWAPELRDAQSPSDFARRAQVMLLSGLASEDAWNTGFAPFPPYVTSQYTAIFKKYYDVRASLQTALYSAYQRQSTTGLSCVRHPVLDFPHDGHLGGITDQYMLGDLMVAPAPVNGTSRSVYFPVGSKGWVDFIRPGQTYAAGTTVHYPCTDDVIPLFQQVGTIIPLVDPLHHNVITLRVIASPPSTLNGTSMVQIYDDDGISFRHRDPIKEYYQATAAILSQSPIVEVKSASNDYRRSVLSHSRASKRSWGTKGRLGWNVASPSGMLTERVSRRFEVPGTLVAVEWLADLVRFLQYNAWWPL
jgi:alpha-D-xyloside xylohydrolase